MEERELTEYDLWVDIIGSQFDLDTSGGDDPTTIMIDLDSCISILLSNNLPIDKNEELKLLQNTVVKIATFLDYWRHIVDEIRIYYSLKPTKLINQYIPEWNEKRNQRYIDNKENLNVILKNIVEKLKKINKTGFSVIECQDSVILDIAKDLKLKSSVNPTLHGFMILSKDPHYECLIKYYKDLKLFNGRNIVDRFIFNNHAKYPLINYTMLSYYYALVGMPRNEFKGVPKWGPIKVRKYINANFKSILKGNDELGEEVKNYVKVMNVYDIIK